MYAVTGLTESSLSGIEFDENKATEINFHA